MSKTEEALRSEAFDPNVSDLEYFQSRLKATTVSENIDSIVKKMLHDLTKAAHDCQVADKDPHEMTPHEKLAVCHASGAQLKSRVENNKFILETKHKCAVIRVAPHTYEVAISEFSD